MSVYEGLRTPLLALGGLTAGEADSEAFLGRPLPLTTGESETALMASDTALGVLTLGVNCEYKSRLFGFQIGKPTEDWCYSPSWSVTRIPRRRHDGNSLK